MYLFSLVFYRFFNYCIIGLSAPFLPSIGKERGVTQQQFGLLFCLFGLAFCFTSLVIGKVIMSYGRKNTIMTASGIYIVSMLIV